MAKKYEYQVRMVLADDSVELEDWLHKMDKEGWELVAASSLHFLKDYIPTEDRWIFHRLYNKAGA